MIRQYQVLWIESICNDPNVIEKNILKVKVQSDDYKGWDDPEKAANDFRKRIKAYEKEYKNLSEEHDGGDTIYIQIIDEGTEVKTRNVNGELVTKILAFLINLHTLERPIFFIQAGDSIDDVQGILGGDTDLSEQGRLFSQFINKFFISRIEELNNFPEECKLLCSTRKSVIQTAREMNCFKNVLELQILEEINYGLQDGKTQKEFFDKYPEEEELMKKDPLNYRYPRGESYRDIIERTGRLIYEIEEYRGPIVMLLKPTIFRCFYGYFAFEAEVKNMENIPHISIEKNSIIKFTPEAYGYKKEVFVVEMKQGFQKLSNVFLQDTSVFYNPLEFQPQFSPKVSKSNTLNYSVEIDNDSNKLKSAKSGDFLYKLDKK